MRNTGNELWKDYMDQFVKVADELFMRPKGDFWYQIKLNRLRDTFYSI